MRQGACQCLYACVCAYLRACMRECPCVRAPVHPRMRAWVSLCACVCLCAWVCDACVRACACTCSITHPDVTVCITHECAHLQVQRSAVWHGAGKLNFLRLCDLLHDLGAEKFNECQPLQPYAHAHESTAMPLQAMPHHVTPCHTGM